MLIQNGVVVTCRHDGVVVAVESSPRCAACENAGCGIGPLVAAFRSPRPTFTIRRPDGASPLEPGQRVRVAVPSASVLRSAIVAFALPLGSALLGAWLLSPVGEGKATDGWAALGALTGLIAGHLAGRGWTAGIDAPRLIEDAGADATARP